MEKKAYKDFGIDSSRKNDSEKVLKRKTVKELVEIARKMNISWYMAIPGSNDGNDTYTDYVTVPKSKLIDRIINKRSYDIYEGGKNEK